MKIIKVLLFVVEPGRGGIAKMVNIQEKGLDSIESIEVVGTAYFSNTDKDRMFFHHRKRVFFLDENGFILSGLSFSRYIQRVLALRRLIRTHSIDAIIAHGEGASWVASFTSCSLKVSVFHGSMKWWDRDISRLASLRRFWKRFCLKLFDVIISVSSELKKEINSNFDIEEVVVIRNCVELNDDLAPRRPRHQYSAPLRICALGRVAPEKNINSLLRIISALKNIGTLCKLILVGDGPYVHDVEGYAKKLGLSIGRIHHNSSDIGDYALDVIVTGYVARPEEFVSQCDVLALPSFSEGYPLSACEALVQGKPVFLADCPTGPREILLGDELTPVSTPTCVPGRGHLLPIPVGPSTDCFWIKALDDFARLANHRSVLTVDQESMRRIFGVSRYIEEWSKVIGLAKGPMSR